MIPDLQTGQPCKVYYAVYVNRIMPAKAMVLLIMLARSCPTYLKYVPHLMRSGGRTRPRMGRVLA